jgi:4-amino-4-deoxy-L-arabinose transferase-like glycosyltransferase
MMERFLAFQANNKQKFRGLTLLAAGIALAMTAQWTLTLSTEQPGFWDVRDWWRSLGDNSSPLPGLMLYALSGWVFIRGLSLLGRVPTFITFSSSELQPHKPRFGFWITSLGLAAVTAYSAGSSSANEYGPTLTVTWLISIGLLIASVLTDENWRPASLMRVQEWFHTHRLELLVMTIIVIAAFFIRFQDVEFHPYSFVNDEGEMGNNGACIVGGSCHNLFDMGWAGQPMLAFLPIGISISIFGHTATAVRLISVILGSLAVLGTYLFTREVFSQTEAWVAAGLLATLPFHVHFSRIGVANIIDSLSTTAVLWLLYRGMKRGSTLYFLTAGILGGLCLATYPGTRLAPILGLCCIGYIALRTRGFLKAQMRNIIIFILALAITGAPILGYFYTHPDYFFARMNSEGIFQNHAFQNEIQNGKTAIEVLTGQFMKSSLVFILTSAPSNFYNSPKPYLTPVAAIFFMLGMAYTLWHIKEERYLTVFIWFWVAIILGSTITGGPPSSQRMLMSTPALAIITALGVSKAAENIPQKSQFTRWAGTIMLFVFVVFVGYQNINFYFYEYRSGHYFEDPTNEFTYETGALIAPLHTNGRFYLIAEPSVPYLSFANFNFFSPDVEKAYFNEVTPQALAALSKDKDALFIATAGRKTDIEQLALLLPGGEWNEVRRRTQPDQVLFYSYKVKQSNLQALKP